MDSTVDLSGLGLGPVVVPALLALPWRGGEPLRVWQVEYRWTHRGSGQSGRAVLGFPARGVEQARERGKRVVEAATGALGVVAYRIEIGEVRV